jgi:hypothetical protein
MIDWERVITAAQRALEAEIAERQAAITATEQQRAQGLLRALEVVARKVIDIEALDDDEVDAVAALYPAWISGIPLAVGDIVSFEGLLYRVIQAHTTQSDWAPPIVPALFNRVREPQDNSPLEWVAGESVSVGDERLYQGTLYRAIQAHTTQADWTPPAVPALWAVV